MFKAAPCIITFKSITPCCLAPHADAEKLVDSKGGPGGRQTYLELLGFEAEGLMAYGWYVLES